MGAVNKCKSCGVVTDELYGGYCLKCFQTVKMRNDRESKIEDVEPDPDDTGASGAEILAATSKLVHEKFGLK